MIIMNLKYLDTSLIFIKNIFLTIKNFFYNYFDLYYYKLLNIIDGKFLFLC